MPFCANFYFVCACFFLLRQFLPQIRTSEEEREREKESVREKREEREKEQIACEFCELLVVTTKGRDG